MIDDLDFIRRPRTTRLDCFCLARVMFLRGGATVPLKVSAFMRLWIYVATNGLAGIEDLRGRDERIHAVGLAVD